jgi:diaminopimelate epimerase
MQPELQFTKYTAFGNTFIIVDETLAPLHDDQERAAFARWALNPDFGIGGADNVLYLHHPDPPQPTAGSPAIAADFEFVFRIFEHDGSETLSCGNGLLCTAAALHDTYGGRSWGVLTEMPSGRPRLVHVGIGGTPDEAWVDMGMPRAVPIELYRRPGSWPASGIDPIDGLSIPLPAADWARGLPATLTLSGSLVFTGEPHLVLLSGGGLPAALEEHLFPALDHELSREPADRPDTAEMTASSLLVDYLGKYVNETYRDLFPHGVHLNFARIYDTSGVIEYRTYERAINRETLACGSGAVAVAYVAGRRRLSPRRTTTLWPYRCRWSWPDASLSVEWTESGFTLTGQPRLVCAGMASPPRTAEYATTAHLGRT